MEDSASNNTSLLEKYFVSNGTIGTFTTCTELSKDDMVTRTTTALDHAEWEA
jgi:hypothetical protein